MTENAEKPQDIAVLIPCYNEEAAIATVVNDFRAQLPGARICVFDNNSSDRTAEVAREAGAEVFDYGNNLRGEAVAGGFAGAFAYPGFVPAYIRPLFCEGKGPFRWVALSGDPEDIYRTDEAIMELFVGNKLTQGKIVAADGTGSAARLRDILADHLQRKGSLKRGGHFRRVGEELEAELNFDQIAIGFNVTYLLDALTAIEAENVLMELKDANSSCLISAERGGADRHVVMPLKL